MSPAHGKHSNSGRDRRGYEATPGASRTGRLRVTRRPGTKRTAPAALPSSRRDGSPSVEAGLAFRAAEKVSNSVLRPPQEDARSCPGPVSEKPCVGPVGHPPEDTPRLQHRVAEVPVLSSHWPPFEFGQSQGPPDSTHGPPWPSA